MSKIIYVSAVGLGDGRKIFCERKGLEKKYYYYSAAGGCYLTTKEWLNADIVKKLQGAEEYIQTFEDVRFLTSLKLAGEKQARTVNNVAIDSIEFLEFEDGYVEGSSCISPKLSRYIVDFLAEKVIFQEWNTEEKKLSEPVESTEYYFVELAQEILLKGISDARIEW